MGGFLSSIFTGSNPDLHSSIQHAGDLSTYGTNTGEKYQGAAGDYYTKLLSGDPATIGQAIAPETKALQDQGEQQKKTMAEFSNRSGGNTGAANYIDTSNRGDIATIISQLISGAAGNLANLGTNNLNLGERSNMDQGQLAQMEYENKRNSLLSNLIGGGIGAVSNLMSGGITSLPKLFSGAGHVASAGSTSGAGWI